MKRYFFSHCNDYNNLTFFLLHFIQNSHCILDISLASLERLHRLQIYPIVILIKFKSTKQIKEVKDSRYPTDKVSAKAAKEMYELALKMETEYRQFIHGIHNCG